MVERTKAQQCTTKTDQKNTSETIKKANSYYGPIGKNECKKFIFDWLGNDFYLGNACKYVTRAGKKDPAKEKEDLGKALDYIGFYIAELEAMTAWEKFFMRFKKVRWGYSAASINYTEAHKLNLPRSWAIHRMARTANATTWKDRHNMAYSVRFQILSAKRGL